jgi:hypothetical protein
LTFGESGGHSFAIRTDGGSRAAEKAAMWGNVPAASEEKALPYGAVQIVDGSFK